MKGCERYYIAIPKPAKYNLSDERILQNLLQDGEIRRLAKQKDC